MKKQPKFKIGDCIRFIGEHNPQRAKHLYPCCEGIITDYEYFNGDFIYLATSMNNAFVDYLDEDELQLVQESKSAKN